MALITSELCALSTRAGGLGINLATADVVGAGPPHNNTDYPPTRWPESPRVVMQKQSPSTQWP